MTEETTVQIQDTEDGKRKHFSSFIYITFFWCMVGVSLIYGFRLWHDIPIHPSFVPIIGAVFAAVLSFTLVIALEHVVGPINIEGGAFKFQGASGPIILWCICFLAVIYGLYLLGMPEVVKSESKQNSYQSCSIGSIIKKTCPNNSVKSDTP